MKNLGLLLLGMITSMASICQSPYTLSVKQEAYEPLENPISLNNNSVWTESSSFAVFFEFELPIFGDVATSVNLNAGEGFNIPASEYYHMLFFHWPYGGPLLLDRGYNTSTSESALDFEIIGEEGERIIKLQWTNAGFMWDIIENGSNTVTNEDFINFQVWLFEEDGKIEMHFGPSSVLNPDSWCNFAGYNGPFSKFVIGDYMIDIFGNADNPSYQWISNEGIVYGSPLIGIPSNETVYEFSPDFTVTFNGNNTTEASVNISWIPSQNKFLFDLKSFTYDIGLIEIYSLDGQKQFSKQIPKNRLEIEIEKLPKGIYLSRIILDNFIITKKIIK